MKVSNWVPLGVVAFFMIGMEAAFGQSSAPIQAESAPVGDPWLARNLGEFVSLYEYLHSHPELSLAERNTAARMAAELGKTRAKVTTGFGGHGVVGVIENGPGPVVLVRTDMDALPVVEETNLTYRSTVKTRDGSGRDVGVMHACGHDIHMSVFVGAARWLSEHPERWAGTVVLVAQPAEELVSGARALIEAGLFSKFPRPDYAIALHTSSEDPTGVIRCRVGPIHASSTSVDVRINGVGGHGAWPQLTVDPIVLAALAIVDFQTIVSREIEPTEPAVVTVGSIHAGSKHNIIPNECELQLTLRTFSEPVRKQLISAIERRVKFLAEAHGAPAPVVTVVRTIRPTVNDGQLVEMLRPAFVDSVGAENYRLARQSMGAEDFSLFDGLGDGGGAGRKIPICLFILGTVNPDRYEAARAKGERLPALHSGKYFPDPGPSIAIGIKAMTNAVSRLLPAAAKSK